MKSLRNGFLLTSIVCFIQLTPLSAQTGSNNQPTDTSDKINSGEQKFLKNTIRFNLSNPMLFGPYSLIFGYERTIGRHQSFSINAGRADFPGSITGNGNSLISKKQSNTGVNFSVDYRFYLKKENKFQAPRGIYIGPYYSYNHFERNNTWYMNSTYQGELNTNFKLDIHTIGAEIGYQFVFWKRLALDLVFFGPGAANYSLKAKMDTNLSPEDEALLFQELNKKLAETIPGYSLVLDDKEFKKSGSTNSNNLGFRYMIHLGFRF